MKKKLHNHKVDHFEKWENIENKPKVSRDFKIESVQQEKVKKTRFAKIIDTPAVLKRKAELEAIKNEISLSIMNSMQTSKVQTEVSIKSRQEELISGSNLLKSLVSA